MTTPAVEAFTVAGTPELKAFCAALDTFLAYDTGEDVLIARARALSAVVRNAGFPPERILRAMSLVGARRQQTSGELEYGGRAQSSRYVAAIRLLLTAYYLDG